MNAFEKKYKPSKKQFIIPTIVFILCAVTSVFLFYQGKARSIDPPKTSFLVPGTTMLDLTQVGRYTIYLELDTLFEGKHYEAPEVIEGLKCEVMKDETKIKVEAADLSYSYNRNGQKGESYFNFTIEEPGSYTIITTIDNEQMKEAVLSVGLKNEKMVRVLQFTVGASVLMLVGIFEFIGYMIYGLIKLMIYKTKLKQNTY